MKTLKKRAAYLIPAVALFALAAVILGLNLYYSSSDAVIYMYHSVREEPVNPDDADLSVRPAEFEKHLQYFTEKGLRTLFASELKNLRPDDRARYVVITLDDGYEDNYTEVFPLLKKYGCKATIFMITGLIGKDGYLTADQLREMTESGLVSIQSHTVSHEPLALGDKVYEEVDAELGRSKAVLEAITGKAADCVSMPNGSFDPVVLELAQSYYDVIFTDTDLKAFSPDDISDIHRVGIYRHHSLFDIKAITNMRGLYIVKRSLQKLIGK